MSIIYRTYMFILRLLWFIRNSSIVISEKWHISHQIIWVHYLHLILFYRSFVQVDFTHMLHFKSLVAAEQSFDCTTQSKAWIYNRICSHSWTVIVHQCHGQFAVMAWMGHCIPQIYIDVTTYPSRWLSDRFAYSCQKKFLLIDNKLCFVYISI